MFVAARDLPVISNDDFGASQAKKSSAGAGLQFTYEPLYWPLAFVADISFIQASPVSSNTDILESGTFSDVTLEATLIENHLGFVAHRQIGKGSWSWMAGGGVASFYTTIEGTKDSTAIKDSGFDFGYWLGGGISYHFKSSLSTTLEARLVSVQTELLDVFEEGTKGNVRLGLNWHF